MSITAFEPAPPPAAAAPPPVRPLPARAVDVFFSPGRLFAELADAPQPPWVGPAVLAAVVMMALTLATLVVIPQRELAEMMFEAATRNGNPNGMTVEQMESFVPIQMGIGALFTAAWAFLRVVLMAALLFVVFSALMGGRARYPHYLSVVSHASLASVLGMIVVWGLQVATRRMDIGLDFALLAPSLEPGTLPHAMLKSVGVFTLWTIVLEAIGVSAVNRKRSTGVAIAILLALTVAAGTAVQMVMRGFSG